jgi:hypothetical protein
LSARLRFAGSRPPAGATDFFKSGMTFTGWPGFHSGGGLLVSGEAAAFGATGSVTLGGEIEGDLSVCARAPDGISSDIPARAYAAELCANRSRLMLASRSNANAVNLIRL